MFLLYLKFLFLIRVVASDNLLLGFLKAFPRDLVSSEITPYKNRFLAHFYSNMQEDVFAFPENVTIFDLTVVESVADQPLDMLVVGAHIASNLRLPEECLCFVITTLERMLLDGFNEQ